MRVEFKGKIVFVGKSKGITIPYKLFNEAGYKLGDRLQVTLFPAVIEMPGELEEAKEEKEENEEEYL